MIDELQQMYFKFVKWLVSRKGVSMLLSGRFCYWLACCLFAILVPITLLKNLYTDGAPAGNLSRSDIGNALTLINHAEAPNSTTKWKTILIYSTLFGADIWPTLNRDEIKTFMHQCEYKDCLITYDKKAISYADAVLFHGVDVKGQKQFSSDKLRSVSRFRKADQKWIFFIQESPQNYKGFAMYKDLFNWVASYKMTSEMYVPYGDYKPLDDWDAVPGDHFDYSVGKDLFAIWLVSNCGQARDEYLKELHKYSSFTVGGDCAVKLFKSRVECKRGSEQCTKFIKRHKFIFAFENSFCDYYVSEKYWQNGIDWGLVPVVMGARYKENVIPGSFIDASKFKSVRELASYLKYLDGNATEYNRYFDWKRKYKRSGREKMCEICKKLHVDNSPTKQNTYKNPWSVEQDCLPYEWKIKLMKKQVEESITRNDYSL